MRLIQKPDWDPKHPYHYHVNGQKVVVTPEDWKKFKDDPTFREVRAAVEAEQAAHPEPEYDEIENPAWRTAYQRIGVSLPNYWNGSKYVQSPLPKGYSRDERGVVMDSESNYYAPVNDMSYSNQSAPFFVNNERSMVNGNTVPVRYEQVQMPERTIRQLKQPLSVDKVMDVNKEREKAVENYMDKYMVKLPSLFEGGEGVLELPNGVIVDIYDDSASKMRNDFSYKKLGNAKKYLEQYLSDYLGRPISFEYYNDIYDNQLILNSDEVEKFSKSLKKQQDYKTQMFLNDTKNLLSNMLKEREYWTDEKINRVKENIEILKNILNSNKPDYGGNIPRKLNRNIAEKKAVISIGDLEKVGTFANGGKLIRRWKI